MSEEDIEWLRRQLERERKIRVQAEAIAEETTRRLYDADRLKSLFVSTVSHELRTPLTPILGFAETLVRRWEAIDEPTRRDAVERIHQNAETLKLLMDSLLDFSQFDIARESIHIESLALSPEVGRLVDQMESLAARHVLDTDLASRATVRADRSALARIVSNLVSNAAKYSPEGARISVVTRDEGSFGVLVVEDTGPGIPEDEQERIFDRFYRSEESNVSGARGLGIGLALVRSLAEAMGGASGVGDGPDGTGSSFWVRLPVAGAAGEAGV